MARLQTSPPQMGRELQAGPAAVAVVAVVAAAVTPGAASRTAPSSRAGRIQRRRLRLNSRLLIPLSYDLRQNGDGDFAGTVAAEGQSDRRAQLNAQGGQIQIPCRQLFAHPGDLAPAAHEPQVAQRPGACLSTAARAATSVSQQRETTAT